MSEVKLNTFKAGDLVYGPNGELYNYLESTGDGKHLVYETIRVKITDYEGNLVDEQEEDGQLLMREKLYVKPPVQVFDKDFTQKKNELRQIEKEVRDHQFKLKAIQGDISSHKKKLECEISRYPNHDTIIKLLNSELPMFKIYDSSYEIHECNDSDFEVFFNLRNGSTGMNPNYNYAVSQENSIVFYNKDAVAKFYKELLEEISDPKTLLEETSDPGDVYEDGLTNVVKSCSLLGIPIPSHLKKLHDKIQSEKKADKELEIEESIAKLQKELSELNS